MFPAYLYGAETWWKIDKYAETILIQERKLLKRILGVKKGTPNDLLYIELKRPDIISRIKDLQYKFNQKICTTSIEDAVVAQAYNMCKDLPVYQYYNQLHADNQKANKSKRITNVKNSYSSMYLRYKDMFHLENPSNIIYDGNINEVHRTTLTKWRPCGL